VRSQSVAIVIALHPSSSFSGVVDLAG